MDHEPVLISTLAVGLVAAFIGGFIAQRLKLPPIVGYIVAGVVIGPFTPGLMADRGVATELAEIGIILLMFGVGIHFSFRDLLAVKNIAVPGAAGQIAVATLLGTGLGLAFGWSLGGALVLGLSISVASTVVLLRALVDRKELETAQGRIAVGWLIVEDLFTVVVLVLLPTIAPTLGGTSGAVDSSLPPAIAVALALGKAALFVALMVVGGARLVPRLLVIVAREGSRELFTLAVLAIALGLAFLSAEVFGVSLALGAFLAGAIVSESDMSHQAAADALPMRDAFAVLFFVSVGMLLDPSYLVSHPLEIAALLALILVAQPIVAFAIVAAFGYPIRVGLTVAAGLSQIGEFSFILGTVGLSLALLPPDGFQLIVASALISITVNPFLFGAIGGLEARLRRFAPLVRLMDRRAGSLAMLEPVGRRAGPPEPRDPVRLRPGRPDDRGRPRPAGVHLRRRLDPAPRGGTAARPRHPGDLRRRLERRDPRARAGRDGPPRDRRERGPADDDAHRGAGPCRPSGGGSRRPDARRRRSRVPAADQQPGAAGPWRPRARGPDGALLIATVRRADDRGRGHRTGVAPAGRLIAAGPELPASPRLAAR